METNDNGLNQQARAYFLEQGRSIIKLYEILNSNLFTHHLKKWTSIVLELVFILVFLFGLIFIVWLQIEKQNKTNNEQAIITLIQALLAFISVPSPFFAFLLKHNRKKNALIHQAFTEIKKMKSGFDAAVKGLGL